MIKYEDTETAYKTVEVKVRTDIAAAVWNDKTIQKAIILIEMLLENYKYVPDYAITFIWDLQKFIFAVLGNDEEEIHPRIKKNERSAALTFFWDLEALVCKLLKREENQ